MHCDGTGSEWQGRDGARRERLDRGAKKKRLKTKKQTDYDLGDELPQSLSEECFRQNKKRTLGMFFLPQRLSMDPLSTACTFNKHLLQMPSRIEGRGDKKYVLL